MTDLLPVFYLIIGVILRFAIPVGITFLLGWFLKRLDVRWQAEAREIQETLKHGRRPVSVQPCWEVKNCLPSARAKCPAYANLGLLCWEVFGANGTIRSMCQDCAYRQSVLSTRGASL